MTELVDAMQMMGPIKTQIVEFYWNTGRMPNNNQELGLPPAESIYGMAVKGISILPGGIIRADFDDEAGKAALMLRPIPRASSGQFAWLCTSDTLPGRDLVRLHGMCKHEPDTIEKELMRAIERNDLNLVIKLLKDGADPNVVSYGSTPLMVSAGNGQYGVVKQLLYYKALVDYVPPNSQGMTPLIYATKNNHKTIVKLLIENKASVLKQDDKGKTAIDYARLNSKNDGDSELYDFLAGMASSEKGKPKPKPAKTDSMYKKAVYEFEGLIAALDECKPEKFNRILNEFSEPISGEMVVSGVRLNSQIIKSGCTEVLKVLINSDKVEVSSSGDYLIDAIKYAPENKLIDTMNVLFSMQIDLDDLDAKGATPLVQALALGKPDVAEYLLEKGANPDTKGYYDTYPLLEACKKNYTDLIGKMISRGANVNVQDSRGRSPLMAAVENRNENVVDMLLAAGSNPFLRDNNNVDAIMIAKSMRYWEMVNTLNKVKEDYMDKN